MKTSFIHSVDARTNLAGANQLEVLLFTLGQDTITGREEVYGINVFKVREVMHLPPITHAPDMPPSVEGMVSVRNSMMPVINLQKFCNVQTEKPPSIMIVTEYNKHIQGFLVDAVETIQRLAWADVKTPPPMITHRLGGLVTAVTELPDNRLVMIMDVEKILADTAEFYQDNGLEELEQISSDEQLRVLFADDSSVARDQVKATLEQLGIEAIGSNNGAEAWEKLNKLADEATAQGRHITDFIRLVITDVEMPEMDGYVLTRRIKEDPRMSGLPVVMHSSLSADANQMLGKGVGADAYVPKFEPKELAASVIEMLERNAPLPAS